MAHLLTEKQINQFKETFNLFDKDKSGSISVNELVNVFQKLGINHSKKDVKKMLKLIDTNNNGSIDFSEFLRMMSIHLNDKINSDDFDFENEFDLKRVFEVFDKDQNGYITASELKQAMESLNEHLTDEEIDDMINEADLNGDGKVNYEEFVKMMKQF